MTSTLPAPAPRMTATQALRELFAIVASDAHAMTFQSLRDYRNSLINTFAEYQKELSPDHAPHRT